MTDKANRAYDVVVWGATGFTGKLVAEYLLRRQGEGAAVKWALGGRNQGKLEAVRRELGAAAAKIPFVLGDSSDPATMDAMAAQTKVVCSTVGPYAKYGSDLVAACAKHGTDYCDLAGEAHWIRTMIDRHHDEAKSTGARIVTSCGFDSIPSDLGVHFLQQQAIERSGRPCTQVKMRVKAMKGGASGGTIASMMGLIEEARRDRNVARVLKNPYGLNPKDAMSGPDKPDLQSAVHDKDFDVWIGPFVMANINTKIVRRSHALLGFPYGKDFRYDEAMVVGEGVQGRFKATGLAVGIAGFALGSAFDFTRGFLKKKLPAPGEGPNASQRERGFFDLRFLGKFEDGTRLVAKVTGDRDPGYGSTSKMLGEAAMCLGDLDDSVAGGVVTPASAMGEELIARLAEHAGLTFELVDHPLA